jgi:hypothetical protein
VNLYSVLSFFSSFLWASHSSGNQTDLIFVSWATQPTQGVILFYNFSLLDSQLLVLRRLSCVVPCLNVSFNNSLVEAGEVRFIVGTVTNNRGPSTLSFPLLLRANPKVQLKKKKCRNEEQKT